MQITYLKTKQVGQVISQTAGFVKNMEKHFKPKSRKYRAMALYFLGEAYYRQQRPLEAVALNEKIITKYWDTNAYAYAKEGLVWGYFEQDQFALALKEADKVIKDRRTGKTIREDIALIKGHCLFNMKRYKPALETYNKWLEKNPKHPERTNIQYLMGLAYYRLKYYKSAMAIWEKVIANPERSKYNRDALLKVADTLFRGMDNPRARARYQLYIRRYPKGADIALAHLRIAQTYYNQGRDGKAIAAYRNFIQRYPKHQSAETARDGIETTAFRQVKKNPELKNLRNYLVSYPKGKFANQIQYQIAERYYKAKNYPHAIREFNRLILNYPGSEAIPNSMFYLGDSYDNLKKYSEAISAYSLFIETYPKHDLMPEVLTRLGADFFLLGNYEDGIIHYRTILDKFPVKPYLEDALYNIAVCYGKMEKHNEAMAMYIDFAARYPKSPRAVEARIQIGTYYQDQQLWDLAISAFQEALTVNSKYKIELYFRLGDSYENKNETTQAMQAYSKMVPMSPKSNIYRITGISQLAAYYEQKQRWKLAIQMYKDIAANATKSEWRSEAAKRVKLLSQP